MLIGTATRYLTGRSAVQTVYWVAPKQPSDARMVKYSKTLNFAQEKATSSGCDFRSSQRMMLSPSTLEKCIVDSNRMFHTTTPLMR